MRIQWLMLVCVVSMTLRAGAAGAADAVQDVVVVPEQSSVEVHGVGEKPQYVLRYRAGAGLSETMVMSMAMSMDNTINGQAMKMAMPKQVTESVIKVEAVTAEDKLEISSRIDKADVIDDPAAPSPMTAQIRPMIQSMVGMKTFHTQTRRGDVSNARVELPADANPMIRQQAENMKQMRNQMAVPFPEPAVGLGASWTVTMPMRTPMMNLVQIATYTVTAITDKEVTVSLKFVQKAPTQEVESQGMKMTLNKLDGSGSGTMTLRMDGLVPTSTADIRTATDMQMNANGQDMTFKSDMTMQMKVERKAEK